MPTSFFVLPNIFPNGFSFEVVIFFSSLEKPLYHYTQETEIEQLCAPTLRFGKCQWRREGQVRRQVVISIAGNLGSEAFHLQSPQVLN